MSALLRWVGSKQWIRHDIAAIVLERIGKNCTYWEPFAGSASVLFTLKNIKQACICDAIEPLIRTYEAIKDEPVDVWLWSKKFGDHGIESYYELRNLFNEYLFTQKTPSSEHEFAGLFIYLNACCFNGLWRQNPEGKFNVPVSDRTKVKIPKQRFFLIASQILQRTDIRLVEPPTDIFNIINESQNGDVIFADPPYYGSFDGYDGLLMTGEGFHERLASTLQDAHTRGVCVVAMNSDKPFVRKLYRDWCRIKTIERHQTIASTKEGRGEWKQVMMVGQ